MMQFIDLTAQYQALKTQINANIQSVLDSAQFIGGPFVSKLEERLASFTGRKYCVTCANGTDALQVAYMALGIGSGDAISEPRRWPWAWAQLPSGQRTRAELSLGGTLEPCRYQNRSKMYRRPSEPSQEAPWQVYV